MNNDNIYRRLIKHFGHKNQIIIAIEELSELQKELCKFLRGDSNNSPIAGEMADVEIMLEQLKLIFNNAYSVQFKKTAKIERTKKRYLE